MRADLRTEAVLERRDDPPATGVVLGVRAGHDEEVERQAQREAAHLDVALLEDVEEADLDALGQVGQLVHGEDAAVAARDQAVVDGRLVREIAALGDLDGVDLADQVGDGDVGGGQLLAVASVTLEPFDRRLVTLVRDLLQNCRRDRRERILVELGPGNVRNRFIEQPHQGARQPSLGLAALAQEHDVLPCKDRVLEGGDDRILVADDAGEHRLLGCEPRHQVGAQLVLHAAWPVPGIAQRAEGRRLRGGEIAGRTRGHGRSEPV